jgi:RNA polymerase sigma factor FliA
VRAKGRAVERAFAELEARLKRSPTESELAEELEMSEAQLQQVLGQLSLTGVAALDEMLGDRGDATTLGDTIPDRADGPGALLERIEMRGSSPRPSRRCPSARRWCSPSTTSRT